MFETFPDIMSVADIRKALRIGRTKAYELVSTGQIQSIKIGNAIRIPKPLLLEYISQKSYNNGAYLLLTIELFKRLLYYR